MNMKIQFLRSLLHIKTWHVAPRFFHVLSNKDLALSYICTV